jgi:DNA end-binding protein Ku
VAARSTWRGFLKVSLVSCPIQLMPATTRAHRISFHNLNRKTNNRIEMVPHDSATGEELASEELVRGYEVEDGRFVIVEDEELEQLQIESSRTIDLDTFVEESEIDPIYYDSSYYLAPDGAPADETFRVIRDAMMAKRQAGLGRVVLASRERRVVVEPRGPGMMMTTLRVASEVRAAADFFGELGDEALDEEMVKLAAHIIEQKSAEFDPSRFEDRYQKALHELVEAKLKGRKPVAAKAERPAAPVIDLMAALKSSLAAESGAKPAAARKPAGRGAKATRAAEKKRKRA